MEASTSHDRQEKEAPVDNNQPGLTRDGLTGGLMRKLGGTDKRQRHQSWDGVKGQEDAAEVLVGERRRCQRT